VANKICQDFLEMVDERLCAS